MGLPGLGARARVLHWDGAAWSFLGNSSGNDPITGATINGFSMWGTGPNDIFLGGNTLGMLRFSGTAWTLESTNAPVTQFKSVWGRNTNDVWAVGNGGIVIHRSQYGWWPYASGTVNNLAAVWSGGVWALGETGTILEHP